MSRIARVSFWVIGWGVIATVVAKGLGFFSTAIQARVLGPQGFGQYGAILTTISLFGVAASASLGAASSTLVAYDKGVSSEKANETISTILLLLVVCSGSACLLFFTFSSAIGRQLYGDSQFGQVLRLGGLALVITAASGVVEGLLAGLHKFTVRNNMPLVQGSVFLLCAATLTPWLGVAGAVWAYTISCAASVTYAAIPLFRGEDGIDIRALKRPPLASFKRVTVFMLPLIGNNFLGIIANWWMTIWIVRGPAGFADLGYFTLAAQLRLVVLIVPFLLLNTYSPVLSGLMGAKDHERVKATLSLCIRLTLATAMLVSLAIIIGFPVLLFFVGGKFAHAAPIVMLGSVNAVLMAMCNFVGAVLIVNRLEKETVVANIIFAGAILLLTPYLCQHYGAIGAMVGTIVAQILQFICILWIYRKTGYRVRSGLATFLAVTIVALVGSLSIIPGWWPVLIQLAAFLLLCAVTLANAPEELVQSNALLGYLARHTRRFHLDWLWREGSGGIG